MATSSKHNSRFSTLKVFKFAAAPKPPPLPPKDPYYLPNPSLRSLGNSLSPDSLSPSQPPTPLSAQYVNVARSPSPTPSYAPSRITVSPYSTTSNFPESASSRKGLFKFSSFGRRPKTPKTAESIHSASSEPLPPPESIDDPSISLPWNFQHNIHVDEGFSGLPPTWSAQLAEAGFSEEEVAAINAKRAESRLRSTRSIYSLNVGRSASPAGTTRSPGYGAPTSAMRRDRSEASLSQVSLASSQRSYSSRSHARKISTSSRGPSEYTSATQLEPEARRTPPMSRPTPKHTFTYPQLQSQSTPHLPIHHSSPSITRMAPPIPPPPAISVVSDNSSSSGASEKQLMARNAPSRSFHIANESVGSIEHSPPPAYMSPKKEAHLTQPDENFQLPPSLVRPEAGPSTRTNGTTHSSALSSSSSSQGVTAISPLAPPRLSLHQDDLSSWTESLFSSIPDTITFTPPKPSVQRTPVSPWRVGADIGAARPRAGSVRTHDGSPSAGVRQLPPQKPLPKQLLKQDSPPLGVLPVPPPSAGGSPLWNEVMQMANPGPTGSPSTSPSPSWGQDSTIDYSTDSYSALLTPVLDEFPPIPRINDPDQAELRSTLGRDKENRDSGLSTMTVTPATIATAAIARSVRPNMVTSPARQDSNGESRSRAMPGSREPDDGRSHSPNSSESHSSTSTSSTTASLSTGTGSASSDSRPQTLTTEASDWRSSGSKVKSLVYSDASPEQSPRASSFGEHDAFTVSITADLRETDIGTFGQRRPSILTDDTFLSTRKTDGNLLTPVTPSPSSRSVSPLSPAPRYPGWLSSVVAPLKTFINDQLDPRDLYTDLREIAEGESGSVFAARVLPTSYSPEKEPNSYVAIKNIAILPSGSPKIIDLERELTLLKDLSHANVLTMDSLYVDLVEDSLWIRMELMERSVADAIALVEEGIDLNEKIMSQIARDVGTFSMLLFDVC
uniref:N/A n=1 Tax=Ganoderma boninense TaxID=34458 RepID=A0A5K1JXQ4_9APHY|nr:N/A [Ganoderma boninense]